MKRLLHDVLLVLLFVFCLLLTFTLGYYVRALTAEEVGPAWLPPGLTSDDSHPLLAQVRQLLDEHYIAPLPDNQKLEYGAAEGYVATLGDPYTRFVEPAPHELESQTLAGEYGGVGMAISKAQDGDITLAPFPDSPAAKAGIVTGDVLVAVDNTPITATTSVDSAVALVRGPIGSQVAITVRHVSGQTQTVQITRQEFAIPSVTYKMVSTEPPVGLMAVSVFSEKTPDEVRQAADSLRAQGATRLILDLRDNPGGVLTSGIDVASLFLDGGVVMYETQKGAPEKAYTAPANSGPLATIPLVILVNHNTASAAEIVSGALLDRNRAPLVGQQTYGKGSVQLVFDLPAGASLHVTSYLWYTPSHRALDKNGLPPTYAVEPATDGSDPQLARAIELLK